MPSTPPTSPPSPANAFTHEARGSGTVWALLEVGSLAEPGAAVLDSVVGKQTKILWRMRGAGDLILSATAPDGVAVAPRSVTPHEGSTWERPGDEWGSTFTFSQTGCWQLHAQRGADAGDVWLLVRS